MKVQGLKENLNKRKTLGVIKELYFTVYWQYPHKLEIKVIGLPKGFKEIKEQLKMAVYSRIPLLFPVEKIKMVSGYKLKYNRKNNIIHATDPTGKKALNEVKIKVLENGMMKSIEGIGVSGSQVTSYIGKIEPWSQKKFIYHNVQIKIKARTSHTIVDHDLKYTVIRGIGVPNNIISTTKILNLKNKEVKILSKVETVFYDYMINGVK
jgi:hypothetical protein